MWNINCVTNTIGPSDTLQWLTRWVRWKDQAQRESYIEIHQHYPSNQDISRHNKTNEAEITCEAKDLPYKSENYQGD